MNKNKNNNVKRSHVVRASQLGILLKKKKIFGGYGKRF